MSLSKHEIHSADGKGSSRAEELRAENNGIHDLKTLSATNQSKANIMDFLVSVEKLRQIGCIQQITSNLKNSKLKTVK